MNKAASCPSCGRSDLDGATHAAASDHVVIPKPEDISICAYCGAINQFTEDMDLKACDIDKLSGLDAMDRARLRKLSEMCRTHRWKSS
jgi:hypothetical protein